MISVVMIGATGAVGSEVVKALVGVPELKKLLIFGRREFTGTRSNRVEQRKVEVSEPTAYESLLAEKYDVAICTLGVGEPSKVSQVEFVNIDKLAVVNFALNCKKAGIAHFQLLSSVGADSKSSVFYLKTKGELIEELKKLNFQRLSVFEPSMIITPKNRYGFSQFLILTCWPWIDRLFFGSLKKYKGIRVDLLGQAIALNSIRTASGFESLTWENFMALINLTTKAEKP